MAAPPNKRGAIPTPKRLLVAGIVVRIVHLIVSVRRLERIERRQLLVSQDRAKRVPGGFVSCSNILAKRRPNGIDLRLLVRRKFENLRQA